MRILFSERQQSHGWSAPVGRDSPASNHIFERCHGVHEALPRFQSASRWYMVVQFVVGLYRLSLALHATWNSSPNVRGAIPVSMCMLVTCASLRQPVMIRQQSCRGEFKLFACVSPCLNKRIRQRSSRWRHNFFFALMLCTPPFERASLRIMLFAHLLSFFYFECTRCRIVLYRD